LKDWLKFVKQGRVTRQDVFNNQVNIKTSAESGAHTSFDVVRRRDMEEVTGSKIAKNANGTLWRIERL